MQEVQQQRITLTSRGAFARGRLEGWLAGCSCTSCLPLPSACGRSGCLLLQAGRPSALLAPSGCKISGPACELGVHRVTGMAAWAVCIPLALTARLPEESLDRSRLCCRSSTHRPCLL